MRLFDYECPSCGWEGEKLVHLAARHDQRCSCGAPLTKVLRPQRHYRPWEPYFDEGLGVFVTGKQHRLRVMRDLGMDFKDHPTAGDLSARKDRANEARRERSRRA